MIIRCSNCGSAFSVDDTKIDQKKFAFNCPSCKEHNVIDNRERKDDSELRGAIVDTPSGQGGGDAMMGDDFSGDDTNAGAPADPIQDAIPAGLDNDMPMLEDDILQSDTPTADDGLDAFTDDEIAVLGQDAADDEALPDTGGVEIASLEETSLDDIADLGEPLDDIDAMGSEPSGVAVTTEEEEDISMQMDDLDIGDISSTEDATPNQEILPQDDIGFQDDLDDELAEIEALDAQMAEPDEISPTDESESISLDDAGLTLDDVQLSEDESDQIQMNGVSETLDDLDSFQPLEEDIPGGETAALDSFDTEGIAETPEIPLSPEPDFSASEEEIDESITIDLDSLDIQLDDEEDVPAETMSDDIDTAGIDFDESSDIGEIDAFASDDLASAELTEMSDEELEDITGDIISMPEDIESTAFTPEPEVAIAPEFGIDDTVDSQEDESITIDLDSLDIPLMEDEEMKEGEVVEDEERLTLEDAGLTVDDLSADAAIVEEPILKDEINEEEDLRLSIDEIDPELDVDSIFSETEQDEPFLANDITDEEMPEIDIDKYTEDEENPDTAIPVPVSTRSKAEDFLDIGVKDSDSEYSGDLEDEELDPSDIVPNGVINFSIDYSLKYSRLGAVLRLFGLYHLRLIPHFIVSYIYILLSGIVGFLNWLIILFTGTSMEDFMWIQENTIRYILSLGSCSADVVEDLPRYAGRKDIDHALQFDVTYPARPSRLLAFLRLTGIGIIVLTLPHLIILMLLTFGLILIDLVGLISIIATGNWPGVVFDFMIRYYRYAANVLAFMMGLIDKYPTFRFD